MNTIEENSIYVLDQAIEVYLEKQGVKPEDITVFAKNKVLLTMNDEALLDAFMADMHEDYKSQYYFTFRLLPEESQQLCKFRLSSIYLSIINQEVKEKEREEKYKRLKKSEEDWANKLCEFLMDSSI